MSITENLLPSADRLPAPKSVDGDAANGGTDPAKNVADFLRRVVPWPSQGAPGFINMHWTNPRHAGMSGKPFNHLQQFLDMVPWCNNHRGSVKDVYFCLSQQAKSGVTVNGKVRAARLANDATFLKAIWLDVDGNKSDKPDKGYPTPLAALDAIIKFMADAKMPPLTALVFSGGGWHVYWISDKPLKQEEWRPYAEGLYALAQKHGLKCDPVTTDAARILRVPLTFNHKTTPPKEVKLLELAPTDYDFATALSHIKAAPGSTPQRKITALSDVCDISKFTGPPVHVEGFDGDLGLATYNDAPLAWEPLLEADGRPHLLNTIQTDGAQQAQPLWHLNILLATFLKDGRELAHRISRGYPTYTYEETEAMWDRKVKEREERGLGWPSCKAIQNAGCKLCATCKHFGKIKSPLNLTCSVADTATPDQEDVVGQVKKALLLSSAEFVADFMPPDYLIDGLMQKRYVYSLTAPTGAGKTCIALYITMCVALGKKLAGLDVEKGRVLFFAGENPDDIRSRWIKLCEVMGQNPDDIDVFFMPGTPPISNPEIRERINAEAEKHGPFSLLIVDTSAAYFEGDDENSNKQLGDHARLMRSFTNLPGGPSVLVTCHPTKNPDMSNLVPRGGGAFLAEVDGNLVAIKHPGSMIVELNTHGKFRGPEFSPISFKIVSGTSDKLVDTKGRSIWTVMAMSITETERDGIDNSARAKYDDLLVMMKDRPGLSLSGYAEALDWRYANGDLNKRLVQTAMAAMTKDKLIEKKNDRYCLTKKGKNAAVEELSRRAKDKAAADLAHDVTTPGAAA